MRLTIPLKQEIKNNTNIQTLGIRRGREQKFVGANQLFLYSIHNNSRRVVHSELLHDVLSVCVNRVSGKEKLLCDFHIGVAFGNKRNDFILSAADGGWFAVVCRNG